MSALHIHDSLSLPTVSIVIASGAGGEFLFRCLDSLLQQAEEHDSRIIVADRCGGSTQSRILEQYPAVTLVSASGLSGISIPELRAMGVEKADGEIVAVIEEHCTAPAGWLGAIRRHFRSEDAAIGGPILDDGYSRLRDWVVYFSEYHNYLPPWPEGERFALNGANIAYRKKVLQEHRFVLGTGYWEVVLHPLLARKGAFRSIPEMGVYHTGPFDYAYYLNQRYLLSRVWGGTRKKEVSLASRLAYLMAAPAIPVLLLLRILRRVHQSGKNLDKFLQALPLLIPVTIAYVWGEWLGYAVGPGNALSKVE